MASILTWMSLKTSIFAEDDIIVDNEKYGTSAFDQPYYIFQENQYKKVIENILEMTR